MLEKCDGKWKQILNEDVSSSMVRALISTKFS